MFLFCLFLHCLALAHQHSLITRTIFKIRLRCVIRGAIGPLFFLCVAGVYGVFPLRKQRTAEVWNSCDSRPSLILPVQLNTAAMMRRASVCYSRQKRLLKSASRTCTTRRSQKEAVCGDLKKNSKSVPRVFFFIAGRVIPRYTRHVRRVTSPKNRQRRSHSRLTLLLPSQNIGRVIPAAQPLTPRPTSSSAPRNLA